MAKKVLHLEEKSGANPKANPAHRDTRYVCSGLPEFYVTHKPLEQLLLNPLACAIHAA